MKKLVQINRVLALPNWLVEDIVAVEDQEDGTIDITVVRKGVSVVVSVGQIELAELLDRLNQIYLTQTGQL